MYVLQTAVKKEEAAISRQVKQKKQLEKVRNKSPSDEHSIVSFYCSCWA